MTAPLLAAAWLLGTVLAHGADAAGAGTRRAVAIDAMQYTPQSLEVHAGDVITWTNQDPFPHTVTSDKQGFDSKEIPAGGTWAMEAPRKGTYPYRCTLHPTMKGVLVVK